MSIYRKFCLSLPALILSFPWAAAAIDLTGAINKVTLLLNKIIILLFLIATVVFLFGVVKFIASAADPAGREKSKGIMLWGIIGMAVMAAAWGVAGLLVNYFDLPGAPGIVGPPGVNQNYNFQ